MHAPADPANPYAASSVFPQLPAGPGQDCWRNGDLLVVRADGDLPERCVKCNAPATMDKPRTFAWHANGWYALILVNLLVYLIAALCVQKKIRIEVGLCPAHRARRRAFRLATAALLAAAVVCLGALAATTGDGAALVPVAVVLILVATVVALLGTRVLTPACIDTGEAQFKGCGEDFLASLPLPPPR
jgi:hypothetical protein